MRKNYLYDREDDLEIENDVQAFFKNNNIPKDRYSFHVDRNVFGDWRHRITLTYNNKEETIDIDTWNGEAFLNEVLDSIVNWYQEEEKGEI